MNQINQEYVDQVNMNEKDLICRCGTEGVIYHLSNHHDGTGMYYVVCPNCRREFNAPWKMIPTLTPTETEKKS